MAIAIPATTGPATVTLNTAAARLHGWSVTTGDVTASSATGTQTSVTAGQVICSATNVAQGEYTIQWQVQLSGAPAAADINNFGLYVNNVLIATAVNRAAAGQYIQASIPVNVPAGGVTVAIKAIGNGTATIAYDAGFALTNGPSAEGFLGASTIALKVFALTPLASDTMWIGEEGLYIPNDLVLVVNSGTLSGSVWIKHVDKFDHHDGVDQ